HMTTRKLSPRQRAKATSRKKQTSGRKGSPPRCGPAQGKTRAAAPGPRARNPFVAAYEAGTLWNQLRWHMQQAWLSGNRAHYEQACHTFRELGNVVRGAIPVPGRDALQERIHDQLREWEAAYPLLCHGDELLDLARLFTVESDRAETLGVAREDVCN